MEKLQKTVLELVELGDLSMNSENGQIELSILLKEAVAKKILPEEVLELVDNIIK